MRIRLPFDPGEAHAKLVRNGVTSILIIVLGCVVMTRISGWVAPPKPIYGEGPPLPVALHGADPFFARVFLTNALARLSTNSIP
ncbi:MAG: hypothetical protein V4481_01780 [Patescibacteria group bacterium]